MKSYFIFFISILQKILLIYSNSEKDNNNQIHNNKIMDDISLIYKWAKKNNIIIHQNLQLKKNELNDIEHNFYYFKSNNNIKNNTLLLRIPGDIMVSQKSIEMILKKSKNKKFSNLWDKILSINQYINYSSANQLFYI